MTEESTSFNLISELSFCVIDLETTGGNHRHDQIIEIGLVKIDNLKIVDQKSFLINPKKEIPEFIQKLTKIKQSDVENEPEIHEVIEEILEFIGETILVAHNTSFDIPFLNAVLERLGKQQLENKVICTNVMTKHLIPEIMNSNLNYMSQLFNIKHDHAHRAIEDAKATAELLIIYLNIFIKKGIRKINQLYYPRNKFELDRIHLSSENDSIEEIIDLVKGHHSSMIITLKGDRGLILGCLPLKDPKAELDTLRNFLELAPWKLVTIKLIETVLEGILQYNNHYLKYEDTFKEFTYNYLKSQYNSRKDVKKSEIFQYDFLVTPHLIKDQLVVFSFLNLNPNITAIFKFPGHRKKMLQYFLTQINRFENQQKGRRKISLHKDIIPFVESILHCAKEEQDQNHLFLTRKHIKESRENIFTPLDHFLTQNTSQYEFPREHL